MYLTLIKAYMQDSLIAVQHIHTLQGAVRVGERELRQF